MIFYRLAKDGGQSITQLDGIWEGATALLCGGGPSLTSNDLRALEQPGLLTVAMNNAARHFRPTAWVCSDDPRCFEPRILADPGIMKFANSAHMRAQVGGRPWGEAPSTYFYKPTTPPDARDPLGANNHMSWTNNTFSHSLYLLYSMGVRRIGLLGSEFGASADKRLYAHDTGYSDLQQSWNRELYEGLAADTIARHAYYAARGLTIVDGSEPSRISPPYARMAFHDLIDWALQSYPRQLADARTLPHCSAFAPERMRAAAAGVLHAGDGAYSDNLVNDRRLNDIL